MRRLVASGALGAALLFASLAGAQAVQVQIQLRGDSNANNDFIAWAPVPATIRVSDASGLSGDLPVVLTDASVPGADCRATHRGAVQFSKTVTAGTTADQVTLNLTLPLSGAPVTYFVAGKFGCPSTGEKDTAIVARTLSGSEIGRHEVMVRIRKDAATLTPAERHIFLSALRAMKLRSSTDPRSLEGFVRTHRVAALNKVAAGSDFYPDQAHNAPAFLAWHRAYLLGFERELQKVDPRVALPYWRVWKPQATRPWIPFTSDFLGSNSDKQGSPDTEWTVLDDTNPLFGYAMPYDNQGEPASPTILSRFTMDWTRLGDLSFPIEGPDPALSATSFRDFSGEPYNGIELNPHDAGHNATGPWMQNCKISPSDPVFWIFHTEHDRLWAEWQHASGHFDNTGHKRDDYYILQQDIHDANYGHFDPAQPACKNGVKWGCPPFGHNLFDTMWPWDGITSFQPSDVRAKRRPPTAEFGLFPASEVAGLWPSAPAKPRPADVIDYAGVNDRTTDLGYGYDDIPFGTKPANALMVAALPVPRIHKPTAVVMLERLETTANPGLLVELRRIVGRRSIGDSGLARRALAGLNVQMLAGSSLLQEHMAEIMGIARSALSHPDHGTRITALRLLLGMDDDSAVQALLEALANPGSPLFTRLEAIRELGPIHNFEYAVKVRPYLHSEDTAERLAAVQALAGDAESLADRQSILVNRETPLPLREAALDSLVPNNPALPDLARALASNVDETPSLRRRAVAEISAYVLQNHDRISDGYLTGLQKQVAALGENGLPREVVDNLDATIEAALSHR